MEGMILFSKLGKHSMLIIYEMWNTACGLIVYERMRFKLYVEH